MTGDHRLPLDREGYAVTVRTGTAREPAEVLVDGKVVAARPRRGRRERVFVPAAELPGDPPRPLTVRVGRRAGAGGGPGRLMETEGTHTVIPRAPPGPSPRTRHFGPSPGGPGPRPPPPLRWPRRHLPGRPPRRRTTRRLR
ncbi:hypothetical protein [Streptomyces eurythermus]